MSMKRSQAAEAPLASNSSSGIEIPPSSVAENPH